MSENAVIQACSLQQPQDQDLLLACMYNTGGHFKLCSNSVEFV